VITLDVAPGVHRVELASTCCYLVEDTDHRSVVLVDGGLPAHGPYVERALGLRGLGWDDVEAIVLTHAHFDHLGVCAVAERRGVRTWVQAGDERVARHPYRYRPGRPRALYPLRYPGSWRHLAAMLGAGALRVEGVRDPSVVDSVADTLLPGGLLGVPTPGHTDGHVVLHLPERDVVLTGDALVTLDPYTGRRGPRLVARAGTHDRPAALASLDAVATTGAAVVLPGHGDPYVHGAEEAAARARTAGAA
jgi:glyoxylase-like metal-dependent hydrolase (beta-lactamase superfamily II)